MRVPNSGFSLIELVIVIAIVALIIMLALPSYKDTIARSRRTDAMIALQQVANRQEQHYFDHNRYSDDLSSLGLGSYSPQGYYTITLPSSSENQYTVRATPDGYAWLLDDGGFELHSSGMRRWDPDGDGTYECEWMGAVSPRGC